MERHTMNPLQDMGVRTTKRKAREQLREGVKQLATQKRKFKQSMKDMKEESEKKDLSICNECKLALTKLLDDKQQAHLQSLRKKEKAHEQTLCEKEHLLCAKYKSFHKQEMAYKKLIGDVKKEYNASIKKLEKEFCCRIIGKKSFDRLKVLQNCFANVK